ncbi:MAG: chromosome segregation protein SMC [Gammaproteobacteria bacterium RIFCSPHIGHO2_12_FULL_40_19]|nr:MAG: chromosome segregation protein SMC [Gammaproteobacteria bacterium RIFCSPHIGHO2_12_FULL_40_19]
MQLSKIKLSGFKSFVDPTTILLPSQLVAVVGPNGCGKSNIIDAVTWVMGESSPKYLRGEALTDVIFNGSNVRKPIGQASVELIFDNTIASIGGEYAKFAEISVKRMLNRDSDSIYYLNGVRCRKRDVVDIFLGTGLGPRSYSIIGQNMINRIIEAKPEELRTYLEEAAGISKYKERRHETELRIQHTKDNVGRINDLRTELEKQLSNLKYQANVAEKFKTLKQQERILRAESYAIQWRQLDRRMVDATLQIQREETALEARNSDLSTADREIEQLRHEQRVAHDAFQEVQRRYYAVGNEITRIEQDVLHHQERQQQWEGDLQQVEDDWRSIKTQIDEATDETSELEREIQQLEPEFSVAKKDCKSLQEKLTTMEETQQIIQTKWDEFNQTSAMTSQTVQVEQTNIQHLEQRISSVQKQQEQLQQEQGRFHFSELDLEIEKCSKESYEVADKLEFQIQQLEGVRKEVGLLQGAQQDSQNNLDNVRGELQRLLGQQASLEALQQTALNQRNHSMTKWLSKFKLESKPRLAQHLEVEAGWELAVETVLDIYLQAVCVDNWDDIIHHLDDFSVGNLCVLATSKTKNAVIPHSAKGSLLIEKIKSPWSLSSFISGIYVADTVEAALVLCESLDESESVITKDGLWLNRSWMKIYREEDPAAGVLQREQELKRLAIRIDTLQTTQKQLDKNINQRREQLLALESQREELQQVCNQLQAKLAQINAQQKIKQEQLTEFKFQLETFAKEHEDYAAQLQQAKTQLSKARLIWQQAKDTFEQQIACREELVKERDTSRQQLQTIREDFQRRNSEMHAIEIRLQTAQSQKTAYLQNSSRLQTQLNLLNERKIALQGELSSMPPMETLKKSLSRVLDKHVSVEVELNTTRVAMESLQQEFHNVEEKRQTIEREINKVRTILEGLRVEWQGWKIKAETIIEQLKETEYTLEMVLKDLAEDSTHEEWQGKLDQVIQRINRLGPINLIAIEEYTTCLERKQYLDKQLDDLNTGLATLEEAINKIDKETKTRFKETFDQVNDRFQELFPTVFGGGKAYLELTSDDLLAAGVTAMACPPGKRNSSIYLLSGGEKSLTAIALIFSIFYLNPAPFCLLDEVDAALDDANVLRFTRLVKSMADKTQFIFISHNKLTIEIAEHLIGVTMNEPGVSRLVSVDIEKAISLAGA